ncbi:MAG: amino acid ABC transporter permease [Solirubrobacterales bacterium]
MTRPAHPSSTEADTIPAPGDGGRQAARERARKAKTRRGQAIAFASSVVVLGGLAVAVFTSSGWPEVKSQFFSVEAFTDSFPGILSAFWIDVKVFLIVEVVVLILGLFVAVIRTSTNPALFPFRVLGAVYCDVFRGIPVVLLIYLFGFGIPALALQGVPTDPLVLGSIALALAYGSYVAEVFRAGILSIHRTQFESGLAIGLNRLQTLRHVVLPQAVRRVRPPLLNDFIALQKDVALLAVVGVIEAYRQAQIDAAATFNYTPLVAAALLTSP